jgi:L-fuculose-phosphate aldolase
MKHSRYRQALVDAAQEVEQSGLSPGTSGNLSIRVPGGFLITPTGVSYGSMDPADTVFLTTRGDPTGDRLEPSSEWPLHTAIYSDRPDAGAIVHLHSPHATGIACLRMEIPAFHYMVAVAGGNTIRCARYETYGTVELALAAVEALEDRRACLLANHGQIAIGPSLDEAVRLAREVEDLAHTYSAVLEAGEPVILPPDEIERVAIRFRTYGQSGSTSERETRRVVDRPTLHTERLVLRPFRLSDAPRVRELAGAREVAENTLAIPHPYPEGVAEAWIASHESAFRLGEIAVFAITLQDDTLVGAVGLKLEEDTGIAELGYWVGLPYWGNGYATEAADALLDFGFESLVLDRIWARAFVRNPASSRVLQKLGMRHEGTHRSSIWKNDELLDAEIHGILRDERDPAGGTWQPRTNQSDETGEPG